MKISNCFLQNFIIENVKFRFLDINIDVYNSLKGNNIVKTFVYDFKEGSTFKN